MKIILCSLIVLSLLALGCDRGEEIPKFLGPVNEGQESSNSQEVGNWEKGSQDAGIDMRYHIKAGTIHYEVHFSFEDTIYDRTKSVLYFEEFGLMERWENYDRDGTLSYAIINDGQKLYTLYPKERSFHERNALNQWGTQTRFDWVVQYPGSWDSQSAKETIAGKDCDVFYHSTDGGEVKYGGWNNILLLTDLNSSWGNGVTRAIEFIEGSPDPELFTVPSDYTKLAH